MNALHDSLHQINLLTLYRNVQDSPEELLIINMAEPPP